MKNVTVSSCRPKPSFSALQHEPEFCQICHRRVASVFMIVTHHALWKKAHACFDCYENAAQLAPRLNVETVSLREYNSFPVEAPQRSEGISVVSDRCFAA